ncbi:MAG: hypothetical protein WCJ13_10055 [Coriobacteriia bacterium]
MSVIVYVDMDNVLVDFASAFAQVPQLQLQEYEGRLDDLPGIFRLMSPMSGAVEGFRELADLFDTYILSTSPWANASAWSDKLEWVKAYLGDSAHKRLILTHNKQLNRGDYLIDDRTKNGASEFEGELVLFGSEAYPDWQAVMKHMRRVHSPGSA